MSVQNTKKIRVNEHIRCKEVRLIDEAGTQQGVMMPEEALRRARAAGLDLVEVSPKAEPPVCRIIDFGKFKYEQEKMAKEAKKKQRVILVKEVRMRPRIEEHDFQVKMKNILRFLEHGDRIKVSMMFRGRELGHIDVGRQVMDRVIKETEAVGEVEKLPVMEGRHMVMYITSLGKGKKKNAKN